MRGVTWRQRSEWVKRGGALWALQSLCFTSLSKKEERARTCIHTAGVSIEQNAWNWVKCETEMNKHVIHKCAACNHTANVWILRWAWSLHDTVQDEAPIMEQGREHFTCRAGLCMQHEQIHPQTHSDIDQTKFNRVCRLQIIYKNLHSEFRPPPLTHSSFLRHHHTSAFSQSLGARRLVSSWFSSWNHSRDVAADSTHPEMDHWARRSSSLWKVTTASRGVHPQHTWLATSEIASAWIIDRSI